MVSHYFCIGASFAQHSFHNILFKNNASINLMHPINGVIAEYLHSIERTIKAFIIVQWITLNQLHGDACFLKCLLKKVVGFGPYQTKQLVAASSHLCSQARDRCFPIPKGQQTIGRALLMRLSRRQNKTSCFQGW